MPRPLINEDNWHLHARERLTRLGINPNDVRATPPAHLKNILPGQRAGNAPPCACASIVPASSIIQPFPETEWKRLIEETDGADLHALVAETLPPHDQGRTNYCWAHGSVRALEIVEAYETNRPTILSAESVAVPLTGGRNRGGYSGEAFEQMAQFGAAEQSYWPHNDLDVTHAKQGWEEDRKRHRVIKWAALESWADQITWAILRRPVAIGLRWWSHLVCQVRAVILDDGTVGIGCHNSWGAEYGDNGYFELTRQRGTADICAHAPVTAAMQDVINAFTQ